MAYEGEEPTTEQSDSQMATDYPTVALDKEQADVPRHPALDPFEETSEQES